MKKHEGVVLKFVTSSGSNVSLTSRENDSNENSDNNVELQKDTEEISVSAKAPETRSIQNTIPMKSIMQCQLHMDAN